MQSMHPQLDALEIKPQNVRTSGSSCSDSVALIREEEAKLVDDMITQSHSWLVMDVGPEPRLWDFQPSMLPTNIPQGWGSC